jgi:hypothetical protein
MESVISLLGGVRNRLHMGLWVLPRPTGGVEAGSKVLSANPPALDFPNQKALTKAWIKVNYCMIHEAKPN